MKRLRPQLVTALALAALVLLVWWSYAPGLAGGFLFDDYANLPALGTTGPVDDWATFWRFVTSGTADPTGRPMALLSFLLDARNWPADPRPFLRTNLFLHLLNGLLLVFLLRHIGMLLLPEHPTGPTDLRHRSSVATGTMQRINLAAVLASGFWLLHPLFVSTTLYIVQREAMLPATFVLLGLLAWLHGRRLLLTGRWLTGFICLVTGLGTCTLLAVLSKGNGILLPALALVLEYTVLPSSPADKREPTGERLYHRAMLVLARLPAGLVGLYLLYRGWAGMEHGISSIRPWTLGQRLLTEPRILLDYLGLLWGPRPFTPGLFNDFIQVSTSVLHPLTTLPALLAVIGLIASAVAMRRRWPALSAAILFYFAGQSIESSTIPLELYYEHRNYLPALLMFWPLALWLCGLPLRSGKQASRRPQTAGHDAAMAFADKPPGKALVSPRFAANAKLIFAVALLPGLALMTHARAGLWGNQRDQALLWAKLNPGSPRAQALAGQAEMAAGYPQLAVRRLRRALATAPDEPQIAFNLMAAECQMGRIDPTTVDATRESLRTAIKIGALLTHWFERNIVNANNPPCSQLSLDTLTSLLRAAQANTRLMARAGRKQDVDYLLGRIALARNDGATALRQFNAALDQQVRISAALQQAALLGSRGFPELGLLHLDHYQAVKSREDRPRAGMPAVHAWVLQKEGYWPHELARLRKTLADDARHKGAVAPATPST
ncbi:MAG: tetratricopeptide repeat protein [Rhodanobacteraceae bacterium]